MAAEKKPVVPAAKPEAEAAPVAKEAAPAANKKVWDYIRKNNLQDKSKRTLIK